MHNHPTERSADRARMALMAKPHPQPDRSQHQRFLDLAAELGADEGEGMDEAVRKVAAGKREPVQPMTKRAKAGRTKKR